MMPLVSCPFIWSNGASRVSSSLMMCQPYWVCTGSVVKSPFFRPLTASPKGLTMRAVVNQSRSPAFVFELCSALDLLDELIGLFLGRHQDVRSVVLRLIGGGVVRGMQVLIRGFIALHVLLRGGVRQNLRAEQSDAGGDLRILIKSALLGLNSDELHVDHLVEDLILLFRGNVGHRFAAQQTFQVIIVGLARNGRAVDDGDRRRGRRLVGGRRRPALVVR